MRPTLREQINSLTKRKSFRLGLVSVFALTLTLVPTHLVFAASADILNKLLSMFAAIAMTIAEVIGNLVVIVLDITIPVMQYQGFTTSPVVIAGWAIVRDVVNMFFVVVLIIIAMGTIFGSKKFEWKQNVPKLMLFALLINFSKTLCGLMIDFAQVIMLTFANALRDIAGGNFIQLLGLTDIFQLSEKAASTAASSGTEAFDLFAGAVAAVLMMVWVLAVVIMLLFILIYRIVMLWVLIVIAPLAWFTSAVPLKAASGSYEEWWKNFICYTSVGPVIVFFLWLTLAVAGAGVIASTDSGFSSVIPKSEVNTGNFPTKIFEPERLMSFVIGMAMLMAGFDAAGKICSGVKGGVNSILAKGKPGNVASMVGKAGSKTWEGTKKVGSGMKTAGLAVGGAALTAGGKHVPILSKTGQADALRKASRWVGGKNIPIVGNMAASKLGSMAGERGKEAEADVVEAGKDMNAKDSETRLDFLGNLARGGKPTLPSQQKEGMAVYAAALKDKDMRAQLEATGDLAKLHAMYGDDMKAMPKDSEMAKSAMELTKSRPDLLDDGTEKGKAAKKKALEKMDNEDVKNLDNTALRDLDTQATLKGMQSDVYNREEGRYLNEFEAIQKGHRGKQKMKALTSSRGDDLARLRDDQVSRIPDDVLAQDANEELLDKHPEVKGRIGKMPTKTFNKITDPKVKKAVLDEQVGIDPATGKHDPQKVLNMVKSDPTSVGKFSQDYLDAHPNLEENIANNLDSPTMSKLIASYKSAPVKDQMEMEKSGGTMDQVKKMLEKRRDSMISDEDKKPFQAKIEAVDRAKTSVTTSPSTRKLEVEIKKDDGEVLDTLGEISKLEKSIKQAERDLESDEHIGGLLEQQMALRERLNTVQAKREVRRKSLEDQLASIEAARNRA